MNFNQDLEAILANPSGDISEPLRQELLDLIRGQDSDSENATKAPNIGDRFGPYLLEKQLGRGGMGTVFLAHREDHLDMRVALKVANDRSESTRKRFFHEQAILARMHHPNIGALYDAGVTNGVPWVIMEYVEGVPVDQWCDQQQLGIKQRIRVFLSICEAVSYAHRQLVIHGDLKPSNILVDTTGTPKLLDFGIASVLDPNAQNPKPAEHFTIAYAAPQQLMNKPLDVGCDVYSLGVILYRLLVGRHPHDLQGLTTTEKIKRICWDQPRSTSEILNCSDEGEQSTTQIAGNRGVSVSKLKRKLKGDLEAILAHTIKANGGYTTVEALMKDLRAYLYHHALQARPNTPFLGLIKFYRRHWMGMIASFGFMIMLALFTWDGYQQRLRTAQERDKAMRERDVSNQVTDFLVELFHVPDPSYAVRELSTQDLVERGSERMRHQLQNDPEVRGRLLLTMGMVYLNMSQFERAETMFREAETLVNTEERRLEVNTAQVRLLREQGNLEQARERAEQFMGRATTSLNSSHPSVLSLMRELALVDQNLGNYASAQFLLEKRLQAIRETVPEQSPQIIQPLSDLAHHAILQGELGHAERHLLEIQRVEASHVAKGHLLNLGSGSRLGNLYAQQGRYEEANAAYRQRLEILQKLYGPKHRNVANLLFNQGLQLKKMGYYKESERKLSQALALQRELLDSDHPDLADSLDALASTHQARGLFTKADKLFREALIIRQSKLGYEHPKVAASLNNLAMLLEDQGKTEDAYSLLNEALAVQQKHLGTEHPQVAATHNNLGLLLDKMKYVEEAEMHLRRSLAIREANLGKDHPKVGGTLNNLANLLVENGRESEAETMYRRALDIRQKTLGEHHREVGVSLYNLALFLEDREDRQEVWCLMQKALSIFRHSLGDEHLFTATVADTLALSSLKHGLYVEGQELAALALIGFTGSGHLGRAAEAQTILGSCLYASGLFSDAEGHFESALDYQLLHGKEEQIEALKAKLIACRKAQSS